MNIEIRKNNHNTADVFLSDGLYAENAALLRDRLVALIEEGVCNLTLDCSELEYVDKAGVCALMTIHMLCIRNDGQLTITGLRGMVEELFRITCLDLMFTVRQ